MEYIDENVWLERKDLYPKLLEISEQHYRSLLEESTNGRTTMNDVYIRTAGQAHKTLGQIVRERYGGEEVPWMVPVRIPLETPDEEIGQVPGQEGTDAK